MLTVLNINKNVTTITNCCLRLTLNVEEFELVEEKNNLVIGLLAAE